MSGMVCVCQCESIMSFWNCVIESCDVKLQAWKHGMLGMVCVCQCELRVFLELTSLGILASLSVSVSALFISKLFQYN